MRFPLPIAALAALVGAAAPAAAQSPPRDQDRAFRATQQGDILPLQAILARIQVRGAQFIGADLLPGGLVYRLRYMAGPNVLWVDVDARTGRILGQFR